MEYVRYSIHNIEAYVTAVEPIKDKIIFEIGNGRYLYIVQLRPNNMSRNKLTYIDRSNFIPKLPLQVLDDIKANVCKLVFDYSFETFDCTHSHKADLCDFLVRQTQTCYNLSKNQIAVITGNVKAFRDVPYTVCLIERMYSWLPAAGDEFISDQIYAINNKTLRKYKIACLMNKPRTHRIQLAQELFSRNMLENNMISLNLNKEQLYKLQKFPGKYDQRIDLLLEHTDFMDSLPWRYDNFKISETHYSPTQDQLYLDSYVNFVSESLVDHTSKTNHEFELDISEKTYKPITRLCPFVIFGQSGILDYLHSIGYKTFNRWWDESYDKEPDSDLRLKKVIDIFETLSSMDNSALAAMLNEMLPILEHNKQVFDNYVADKKHRQEFDSVILAMFDK